MLLFSKSSFSGLVSSSDSPDCHKIVSVVCDDVVPSWCNVTSS